MASHNMMLMSKYKGQHGGKKGQQIRARPSPSPFRAMPERNQFFSWEVPLWMYDIKAGPCCSRTGWCGPTTNHCDCADCIDYKTNAGMWFKCCCCCLWRCFLLHSFSSKLLIPLAGADAEMNLEGSDPSTVKDECRLRCSQLPTIFYSGIRMVGLNR